MHELKKQNDTLVIDIGAQIGQFTLFAAKLGHHVICVEPFIDNVVRLHKAIGKESLQDRVTLVQNAIFNKRNQIKMLSRNPTNIGGQSLVPHKDLVFKWDSSNKYLVETILFDDLVDLIPKRDDGSEYEKAVLKIDIEGFEQYAFQRASHIFDKLNFVAIFMEWGNLREPRLDRDGLVLSLKSFFVSRNYRPMSLDDYDEPIDIRFHDKWPMDIVWIKAN